MPPEKPYDQMSHDEILRVHGERYSREMDEQRRNAENLNKESKESSVPPAPDKIPESSQEVHANEMGKLHAQILRLMEVEIAPVQEGVEKKDNPLPALTKSEQERQAETLRHGEAMRKQKEIFIHMQQLDDLWVDDKKEKQNDKVMITGAAIGGVIFLICALGGNLILGVGLFVVCMIVAAGFAKN
jgi:hypothetical protein